MSHRHGPHHDHHLADGQHHVHGHGHAQGHVDQHLLARLGWAGLQRRSVHRLDRRRFVADLGRGTFAMAILGVVGCSSSSTAGSAVEAVATEGANPTSAPAPTDAQDPTAAPDPTASETGDATDEEATAEATDELVWEQVSLGFVSAYVLVRGNSAAVADSGTPGSGEAIGAGLATLGVTFDDVDHIVLTHLHGDHVGGLPEILEVAESAAVYAGRADITHIDSPVSIQPIGDGDDVFGLQVFETPGHTPGSISLLDPGIGLLIAGDAINTNGDGTEITAANERFSSDMDRANESVLKLAALEPDAVVVGHGNPVESGAAALLTELADSL